MDGVANYAHAGLQLGDAGAGGAGGAGAGIGGGNAGNGGNEFNITNYMVDASSDWFMKGAS